MTIEPSVSPAAIERLLRPKSIAIVGASPTPSALGAQVLRNIEKLGYAGEIHLINPKRDEINGRPCIKAIADLPEGVDVAMLAIPRAAVVDTIRQLAGRGTHGAIIFSAGFAEGGAEGLAEQKEIGRIARDSGMVVEGPNCLGSINFVDGIPLSFIDMPAPKVSSGARVGIVSQSGAMAAVLGTTLMARELALSYFVSTGNEAGSGVEDYLEFMIGNADTQAIALVVEQFRNPARFLKLARAAREAGKPVVLLHPGKSSAARESAATHTGAMAGDYQVMRAKVERAGVVIAESLEELGDIVDIAVRCPTPPSGGTAVLAESGAFKALTLDFCEEIGLALPPVDDADSPALRAALPDFVGVSNPLDLTAQGLVDPDMYSRVLAALGEDDRFGTIALTIIQTDESTANLKFPPITDAVRAMKPGKAVVFAGLDEGAIVPDHYVRGLRALGVPYFPSTERAFRAIKRMTDFAARDFETAQAAPLGAADLPLAGVVPEYRAKALLAPIGIPFPEGRFVRRRDEAAAAAAEVGYPVVLKAQSPDLSHKSDAGGVVLNLADEAALLEGWDRLHANVAAHMPGLTLDGVLIEGMGKRGTELIVGARNDADWGPVILVGFGGVTAELFHDVRLLTPDLPVAAIKAELLKLKSAALLTGFRGSPALDLDAVAELIAKVARLMNGEPTIREIDLNPVIAYPAGEGCIALDALMLVGDAGGS